MRFTRRRALGLGAGILAGLPPRGRAQPAAGATHTLVVGINQYRTQPLQGCVNDARLLAAAFLPHAASVTTLLDRDATRRGLLSAWEAVAERCGPGDRFVFCFSGHGAQRPERVRGNELDGKDEFLVLRDFHERDAPEEILLDDEMEAMLSALVRRGVETTYVADCCHSGGTTRGLDRRAPGPAFRTMTGHFDVDALMEATLRMPPPPPAPPADVLDRVLFIHAGTEAELIPEITWQGNRHGALSVAIGTALAGAADRNRDGVTTQGELRAHLLRVCRGLADSRQHPDLSQYGQDARPVFRAVRAGAARAKAAPVAGVATPDPPVRLRVANATPAEAARLAARIPHAVLAPPGTEVDLTWDVRTSEAVSQLGDVLGNGVALAGLPAVVDRVRAQRRLSALLVESGLDIRLLLARPSGDPLAHDAVHREGTELLLDLRDVRGGWLVVFNIAGNGTVQLLHPESRQQHRRMEEPAMQIGPFGVQPPFGTDLIVAVASDRPMGSLVDRLEILDQQARPLRAIAALQEELADALDWQVGLQAIVTRA